MGEVDAGGADGEQVCGRAEWCHTSVALFGCPVQERARNRGLGTAQVVARKTEVAELIQEMEASIAEANAFIDSLQE